MKKLSSLISTILLVFCNQLSTAQCFIDTPPTLPPPQGGANQMMAPYDSKNGWYMPASGEVRILFVLYEVNYTAGTDPTPPNGTAGWPAHQLPTWANQITEAFTPVGISTKPLTQYFQLASSGNYIVLGDYLLAPNNGGIFSVNSTTGSVGPSQAITAVNAALGTSIVSGNGFTSITDFDKWTIGTATTGPGQPKITPSTENPANKYDHVMFICRNSVGNNGTGYASWAMPANMLGFQANTHSSFGAYDGLPFNIIRHEFSHMIYGDNYFHCGGGGWGPENYWLPLESGWSNMSLYNGSLNSWNAWDRLRLDWKATGSTFGVAARNQANTAFVNGDLDATNAAQAGIYTLRDFTVYGDAIRIKLPFTNPTTEFPMFLWIENHRGLNANGIPFDKWQHETGNTCVQPAIPGLYAYIQVDKEVRSGASASDVYYGYADYLRPITADGLWDRDFENTQVFNPCVQWGNTNAFIKNNANPLTGGSDQDFYMADVNNDNLLNANEQYLSFTEKISSTYNHNLYALGNTRHAFTFAGNKKIGMGTNPSSASLMNLVSYNYPNPTLGIKNLRKIYLNGISIEILSQTGGNIQVQIRFNDVDINNDARWCGDEIVLNPIASASGYSMNIKTGKTVTLDQGTTATRMNNPQVFNGKKIFVSNTLFRATANAIINMETGSFLTVDNNSILRMETGSTLNIASGAIVRVKRGGRLELQTGCTINVADGGKIIIEEEAATNNDGWLVYFPSARINLNGTNAQLEIAGFLDIQNNATFTTSSTANINSTLGSLKFSSTDVPSQNIIIGTGCKFIIQSNIKARKILYVNQETLYGPNALTEFSLQNGTAIMAANARIQAPISNTCTIKFINAQLTTSNNIRNNHRGLRLNGQALVTISGSTFAKGYYGLYDYSTTLGNGLTMTNTQSIDCDYGLYTYDKNVNMTGCSQQYCTVGWYAEQMASTSTYTTSNALYNTQNGIYYQGVSTLNVNDPLIDNNLVGLTGEQASVYVKCGSVSTNSQYGMYMKNSATLFMSGSVPTPHDPTTALNNGTTIKCLKATNVYLNLGNNSLKPLNIGQQKTLNGTLLCQTYPSQPANQNNWNGSVGTALTFAEYLVTTSCTVPVNVTFTDPSSVAQVQCGQAIPPCNPPCNQAMMDPLANCPTCDNISTPDYPNTKLNDASIDAKATAEDDNLTDNEKIALDKYNQILMEPLQNIDIKEDYILNYDYQRMKESFSDALSKFQLYPDANSAPIDQYMQMLLDVQDKIISQAVVKGNYDIRLFVSLDKAQTYRISGKIDASISLLDDVLSWVGIDEFDYVNRIRCLTQIERDVLTGVISPDDVESAMQNCTSVTYRIANHTPNNKVEQSSSNTDEKIQLFPNPANNQITILSNQEGVYHFTIFDAIGKVVESEIFTHTIDLSVKDLSPGIYFYSLKNEFGNTTTGKLNIQR